MTKNYEVRNLKDGIADVVHICVKCGSEIISKAKINKTGALSKYIENNRKDSSHHLFLNSANTDIKKPENMVILVSNKPFSSTNTIDKKDTICKACYDKMMVEEEKKRPALLEQAKKVIKDREEYKLATISKRIKWFDDTVDSILNKKEPTLDDVYFKIFRKNGETLIIDNLSSVKFIKGWLNLETKSGKDFHFYNESYETNYRIEDFKKNKKEDLTLKRILKLTKEEIKEHSKFSLEDVLKAEPDYFNYGMWTSVYSHPDDKRIAF